MRKDFSVTDQLFLPSSCYLKLVENLFLSLQCNIICIQFSSHRTEPLSNHIWPKVLKAFLLFTRNRGQVFFLVHSKLLTSVFFSLMFLFLVENIYGAGLDRSRLVSTNSSSSIIQTRFTDFFQFQSIFGYRISSIESRGSYFCRRLFSAALIRRRLLIEGGS